MTKLKKLQIANHCNEAVAGLFAKFHNVEIKGANFNWKDFPKTVEAYIVPQVFLRFPYTKYTQKEIEQLAAQYCKSISMRLISLAGYTK